MSKLCQEVKTVSTTEINGKKTLRKLMYFPPGTIQMAWAISYKSIIQHILLCVPFEGMAHQEKAQKLTATPLVWPRAVSAIIFPLGFQDGVRALEERIEGWSRWRRLSGEERKETRGEKSHRYSSTVPLLGLSRSRLMRKISKPLSRGSGQRVSLGQACRKIVLFLELIILSPCRCYRQNRELLDVKSTETGFRGGSVLSRSLLKNELRVWGPSR